VRIAVIGAGAIGGTIAALLDRQGHDVEVTARGDHLEAIQACGIQLSGGWGEHIALVAAAGKLSVKPDLAFLCTKAQDAAVAITSNRHLLGGVRFVVVQNGLDGLDTAASLLPDSECMGALALYAANYTEPGRIKVTATGPTYFGAGTSEPSKAVRETALMVDSAMPSIATGNFVGCQWSKLIVNQVNAAPAITGLSVQECVADSRVRRLMTASMREAVRIGFASGVRYGEVQGLSNSLLRTFARAPLALGEALPRLMARRMGSTPNLGSTLQSLKRGQRTEIDYLNGAVVAAAAQIGRSAPVNATLVNLVHEVERTGAFVSPAALGAMFHAF
jgi:2-dehydropantoate 2-reductase